MRSCARFLDFELDRAALRKSYLRSGLIIIYFCSFRPEKKLRIYQGDYGLMRVGILGSKSWPATVAGR